MYVLHDAFVCSTSSLSEILDSTVYLNKILYKFAGMWHPFWHRCSTAQLLSVHSKISDIFTGSNRAFFISLTQKKKIFCLGVEISKVTVLHCQQIHAFHWRVGLRPTSLDVAVDPHVTGQRPGVLDSLKRYQNYPSCTLRITPYAPSSSHPMR